MRSKTSDMAAARLTVTRLFSLLLNPSRAGVCRANVQSVRLLHSTGHLLGDKKYTKKHEWISVDNGIGTVGVSNYAQEALGDIVYAELPEIGREVSKDDEFAVLESVKAASDIYAPASGEVVEVNSRLEDDPGLVNRFAEDEGWMVKIKLSDPTEVDELLSPEEYKEFKLEEGEH